MYTLKHVHTCDQACAHTVTNMEIGCAESFLRE